MRCAPVLLLLCSACIAGQPVQIDPSGRPHDAGRDVTVKPGAQVDAGGDALSCLALQPLCGTSQPPCDGCCVAQTCVSSGASCGLEGGTCLGTSCSGAGGLGEACATVKVPSWTSFPDAAFPVCAYEPWTGCVATNAACSDGGRCVACGLDGEPCCEGYCNGPASCFDGLCTTACGAVGQRCCFGDASSSGRACDDGGVCFELASGPACVPSSVCDVGDAGTCTNCGNPGQSCCGDGGCNIPSMCDGRGMCLAPTKR